jgi:hypothetical protein
MRAAGGGQAVLRAGCRPVYVVVTDGFQSARRLVDFLAHVSHTHAA